MASQHQSPFPNEDYTVGWMCALPVEFAAARGMLDEEHGEPQSPLADADNNSYVLGTIGKFKVVVACLPLHQLGAASAAASAKEMLFTFPKIRVGLLVGIGAGIPGVDDDPDIRLGDVVVGTSSKTGGVIVYDFGKQLSDGSFESLSVLNRPPRSLASALTKLQTQHVMNGNQIMRFVDEMLEKYPSMLDNGYTHPGLSSDRLFLSSYQHAGGKTSSGNMVVKDAITRDKLREKHGAICLEMEAAGLMNNFPCLVIRGISDYADSHKNDRWKPFAPAVAAAYTKEFLGCVQIKDVDGEPTVKDIITKVHEDVVKIRNLATLEQYQHILEWLTPLNADDRQNDILKKRQEGTGLWFLQSAEFSEWTRQPNQTLFCPGIPGAGKSMMSAIVVEYLKLQSQENPDIHTCSIFCSYQPNPQESVVDLLLSLLRQLAVKGTAIHPGIENMYARHSRYRTRPSMMEIKTELVKVAQQYKIVFIVIDALDEYCSSSAEELQKLLTTLFNLQAEAPINILATSRPHSQILLRFEGCARKEIRAQDGDIETYVNERMLNSEGSAISYYPEVQVRVRHEVMKSVDGMFLLAELHMNHLMDYITQGELEIALEELPHGNNKLTDAYNLAMAKIEAKRGDGERYKLAVQILSWLAYSKRALFAKELQHALATRPGDTDLNPKFLPPLEIIGSLCAGLVEHDQNTGIIRLVHYTTKEFLVKQDMLQDAEMEITKTSITYLSFGCFSSGRSTKPNEYTHRQKKYPLHHYSAQHWASHASAALVNSEDTLSFLSGLLEKDFNVYAAGQAMMAHSVHGDEEPMASNWLDFIPRRMTKVHLVASGEDMNARDSDGMTPLAYATRYGQLEVVKLLLKSGSTFPDVEDHYGRTPEIAQLLIQYGANPQTRDDSGCSPLCGAADTGDMELIQFLIDKGVTIDNRCSEDLIASPTPLGHAFSSGKKEAEIQETRLFTTLWREVLPILSGAS
ncbi:hypothetical protein BJX61DRAFT_548493 [Aspergillus egyptiacus]|nr:hypothetical protein BJX61DRAFT_548493 [Aspergillus egyptiacus]